MTTQLKAGIGARRSREWGSREISHGAKARRGSGVLILAVLAACAAMLFGISRAVLAGNGNPTSDTIRNLQPFRDPSGYVATYNVNGATDTHGAFFQSLGTNGRTCASCHVPTDAWGLSAAHAQARFAATQGQDPLFAPVDGSNCPDAAPGDASARTLLLQNGLIRISLPVPSNAQFTITVAYDPYGCAMTTGPNTGQRIVSVYRRPLPSTNLGFLSAVMFDARQTITPLNNPQTFQANLVTDLTSQALDATMGHAQAAVAPTAAQLSEIVNFEAGLFTAQIWDDSAGYLGAAGATGGPFFLKDQPYYPGINDSLGADPTGAAFNQQVFSLFVAWLGPNASAGATPSQVAARQTIAEGERLFNTFPLTITRVRGLNDNVALGRPTSFTATCSACHDAPDVGDHSLPLALDIGTSHSPTHETDPLIANAFAQIHFPSLPVYLISGCPNPFDQTQPVSFYTTDPGRALITGQCADFNRIKGPILRGLAARAPYFHNGAAATLEDVVNFYNQRFQMGLTEEQTRALVAFLKTL